MLGAKGMIGQSDPKAFNHSLCPAPPRRKSDSGFSFLFFRFSCFHDAGGAGGGSVMMKQCKVALKKSGSRVPTVELVDIGPSLTMLLGRYREPSSELYEQAVPKVTIERSARVGKHSCQKLER